MLRSLTDSGRAFLRRHPRLWSNIGKLRVALRPHSLRSRLALANALAEQGDNRLAEQHYRRSLALFPRSPELLLGLSRVFQEADDYDQALAHVEQALELQPDLPGGADTLFQILFWSGRWRDAFACRIRHNRRKLERDPNDREALFALAQSLHLCGELAEAQTAWDRALALDPLDLGAYRGAWETLASSGCFELAQHYYRQQRAAQREVARRSGFADDGTRYLRSTWAIQIGHLAHLDFYIKTQQLGWSPAKRVVLLAEDACVANRCYLDCWKPYIDVVSDPHEIKRLSPRAECFEDHLAMQTFAKTDEHVWMMRAGGRIQQRWQLEGRKPLLMLSEDHIRRGWEWLKTLGVPANAWFVTLHVREPGFHRRDPYQGFRDASLCRFLKAVRHVVARGGWVIRMGNPNMTPMPATAGIIDYAHFPERRDWIDVFLAGQCRFHIGTQSGFSFVPGTFGVPTVWTNFTSWGVPANLPTDLFLPKQFWSEAEHRPLTLEEVLGSDLAVNQFDALVIRGGALRLVENTEDEILDVVSEMSDRMAGSASYTSEDEKARADVRRCAMKYGITINARVGRAYLRGHRYLLSAA